MARRELTVLWHPTRADIKIALERYGPYVTYQATLLVRTRADLESATRDDLIGIGQQHILRVLPALNRKRSPGEQTRWMQRHIRSGMLKALRDFDKTVRTSAAQQEAGQMVRTVRASELDVDEDLLYGQGPEQGYDRTLQRELILLALDSADIPVQELKAIIARYMLYSRRRRDTFAAARGLKRLRAAMLVLEQA